MEKCSSKLTVYFESPFWVGIYEREYNGCYEVSKIIFGAEPKDYDVYALLLKHWTRLKFSPSIQAEMPAEKRMNPKRLQRNIKKQVQPHGVGTKAQQALKLQAELRSSEHKAISKKNREDEKNRKFALRQEKRKVKHKGH